MGAIPPKRKADFEVLFNGCYNLIECKSSRAKDGFLTSLVKPHQHESLARNARAGGRSWFFIGSLSKEPFLYTMSYGAYMNATKTKRFVKWQELEEVAVVLGRMPNHGHPYYDLTNIPAFRRPTQCP
jgi:penicillin-binding protein-related factor A (putative recombinase)